MSSIGTTAVTIPGEDKAAPTDDLPTDMSKTKTAKVAKARKGAQLVALDRFLAPDLANLFACRDKCIKRRQGIQYCCSPSSVR